MCGEIIKFTSIPPSYMLQTLCDISGAKLSFRFTFSISISEKICTDFHSILIRINQLEQHIEHARLIESIKRSDRCEITEDAESCVGAITSDRSVMIGRRYLMAIRLYTRVKRHKRPRQERMFQTDEIFAKASPVPRLYRGLFGGSLDYRNARSQFAVYLYSAKQ